MSLLKRRSRSESRNFENTEKSNANTIEQMQAVQLRKMKNALQKHSIYFNNLGHSGFENMGRRKTSAELISEAKISLGDAGSTSMAAPLKISRRHQGVGGLRLVSTRRPITPREPERVLYGKVALAGRPPSSFSLRYLQSEGNRTPMTPPSSLEPIKSLGGSFEVHTNISEQQSDLERISRRSRSLDSRLDFRLQENYNNAAHARGNGNGKADKDVGIGLEEKTNKVGTHIKATTIKQTDKAVPRKLPALEIKVAPPSPSLGENSNKLENDVSKNSNNNGRVSRSKTAKTAKQSTSKEEERTTLDVNVATTKAINLLTSRKLLTRSCDVLSQSTTEKLIELLKEHAGLKDCSDETVNHVNSILVELYERVHKNEKQYKRGFILGGLYGLVECSSPRILLAVARVVLALRVTGSNLTGACKLIFKVARNEQNDHLFHDNDLLELLIDGLGQASPLDDPEACIYGYGSIRFLTSSADQERTEASSIKDINKNWSECLELPRKPATAPAAGAGAELVQQERVQKLNKQNSLVERLARHGAVQLMILHLQILNESGASKKLTGAPLHSLYQLSAALRALADVRQSTCSLEKDMDVEQHQQQQAQHTTVDNIQFELACPHLIRAAEISIGELEVQANIVRTLSVLSEDLDCCHVLSNFTARIGMLLGPCYETFNSSSEKLLSLFSRLGFILGNIMAKYDNARIQFYYNDVAMEYLLNVLELYSKQPLTLHNSLGDTVSDVLIKMTRVIANMSVNTEVGFGLGNTRSLGTLFINLLNTINQTKSIKMKLELQELTHATLGALHNLCFYQDKSTAIPAQVIESEGSLQTALADLATTLCAILRAAAIEDATTQVETVRVLGNLTRNEKARKYFCNGGGLPLIVKSLTQNPRQDYDLKACAIGVLVNLLGDSNNRTPFLQLKGIELLSELLKGAVEQEDWFLATVVCQAIWNLLIDMNNLGNDNCKEHILDDICDVLAEALDEERIFEGCTTTDVVWEDFAIVATDLLERIQSTYDEQDNIEQEAVPHSAATHNHLRNGNAADDEDDEADVCLIDEM